MTERTPTLVLATSNPGKREEFSRLLPASVRVLTLADLGLAAPPEEGTTLAENARMKALAAAAHSGLLALADDSGLEVDALGGAPGVRSARYAGEPPSDQRNRELLLRALQDVAPERRTARFRCAVAIAWPGAVVATAEGLCEGRIASSPSGSYGFGYDPIFELPDGRTMAQLTPEEKNEVSHRAAAYRRVLPRLREVLGISPEEETQR